MIAIQIKKIKFYDIKSIIIPLGPVSLEPVSLGPASARPSDDETGAAVEIGEGTSTSGVDSKCERRRLSLDAIPAILDI